MKKLMIALGAVAVAAGVQAASFSWNAKDALKGVSKDKVTAGLEGGTTYSAATLANTCAGTGSSGYGAAFAYTLIFTDTTEGYEDAPEIKFQDSLAKNEGLNTGSKVSIASLSDDGIIAGHTYVYTLYYTEIVPEDGAGVAWTLTSNTITDTWKANAQGDILFAGGPASSWSTEAVPEPTSGLLLLLGVAGLALRRRRA